MTKEQSSEFKLPSLYADNSEKESALSITELLASEKNKNINKILQMTANTPNKEIGKKTEKLYAVSDY